MPVSRKAGAPSPSVVSIVAAVAIALALAVAAFVFSLAFLSDQGPALGFRTANAQSTALTAELNAASSRSQAMAQIAEAKAIIAHDATNVGAVRSLAILLDQIGQQAGSRGLLTLAERLSRRDALTELALIETAVAHGSIDEALRHYDRVLTTNPNTADMVMPVLVRATADPDITRALTRTVARRPTWWPPLLDGMIASGTPGATAQVAHALALRPDAAIEGWRLGAVIEKLANAGEANMALRLAQQARPELTGKLVDGDFEQAGNLAPFDWKLTDGEGLAAVREQREGAGGNFALSLVASSGKSGEVARRLLLLPSGRYALRLRAGELPDDPAGRPRIALRCATKDGAMLVNAPIDRTSLSVPVTIPQGCSGQWLAVSIAGAPFDTGKTPWIDDVVLEPAA